ncbi:MAG: hypothetical protein F4003_12565 [Acidimicrobiaceae bacterium]|nr:hypothetical protein [Acidimicrobiaceae bacterium]MYC41047.1 hypothetical protein [Acidimicrobiaceae bacterium]
MTARSRVVLLVLMGTLTALSVGCLSDRQEDAPQVLEPSESSDPLDLERIVRSTVTHGLPAAVLVVENASGSIVDSVIVGEPEWSPLNGGTRSAGSVMKVLVLAAAIETGTSPGETLDVPRCFVLQEQTTCAPAAGRYTVAEATTSSINPAFVLLYGRVPRGMVVEHGAFFDMDLEDTPTVILGVHPVSMESIAALFVAIANDGVTKTITDQDGLSVVPANGRYVSRETAGTLRSLLRSVVTEGTGVAADGPDEPYGKTGTAKTLAASGQTDAWFAGSTETHTIVVWVGPLPLEELSADETPRFVPVVSGGGWPAEIFRSVADGIKASVSS